MKILINAYACSPYQGSEPGMGWNFVKCLSDRHELHVITECKYRDEIADYMAKHSDTHIKFYFLKRTRLNLLRKIWPPSYYWTYKRWQKKALALAEELDKKEDFDLVHQLNMVGYREPGFLWKMRKPFVWGPMGGFNITPWKLLHTMGLYGLIFYTMRNLINLWQMHTMGRVKNAVMRADALMCATKEDSDAVVHHWGKENTIMPEVGYTMIEGVEVAPCSRKAEAPLKVCWSGLHIPRKSLNFLLEAVAGLENVELHVLGDGPKRKNWMRMADGLGVNNVRWYGKVDRQEALRVMNECDVFAQTSLSDATSTVILEALSLGKPVVALDHLGFANVITEECGIKVPVDCKKQIIADLASSICKLRDDNELLKRLSKGAIARAEENSWEHKADVICELYKQAIKKYETL